MRGSSITSVALWVLFLASCSMLKTENAGEPAGGAELGRGKPARYSFLRRYPTPGGLGPDGGRRVFDEKAEYPGLVLIDHPEVDRFIEYYTKGSGRSFVVDGLERRARVLSTIEPIFESYGVPKELANIAFVESRFVPSARSRDGSTVGMWQLSAVVARNYGLKTGRPNDERTDVKRSSEAAARFLASLYDSFGDWYLAAAAWNLGPSAVQKAVNELQRDTPITSQELFDLTSRGLVCQVTREFVAKVAALAIITKDPTKYGFSEPPRLGAGSVTAIGVGVEERQK